MGEAVGAAKHVKSLVRDALCRSLDWSPTKRVLGYNRRARLLRRIRKSTMDQREDLYAFWRQPAPDGNAPMDYAAPVHRSEALCSLLPDSLSRDARILEVGCNVGRNLNHLVQQCYAGVEGIEISPHAVELLRKTYPALARVPVRVGPAEDILPECPDGSYDLVFTMAVLEHIHPDSSAGFGLRWNRALRTRCALDSRGTGRSMARSSELKCVSKSVR